MYKDNSFRFFVSSCNIPINLVGRNRGPEAERPIPEAVEGGENHG